MTLNRRMLNPETIALVCAGGAAVCTVISIAATQILLGGAVLAIVAGRIRPRVPPILWPLGVWFVWTLLSILVNGHAIQALPQVKKFYVYLVLLAIPTAVQGLARVGVVLRWLAAAAAASSAWSVVQFYEKYSASVEQNRSFYEFYVGDRVTGFMSHWMTFGGEMMIVVLLIGGFVLFAPSDARREKVWFSAAAVLITLGLILAWTRGMWVGAAAGGLILLWNWRRWSVLLAPVPVVLILVLNP
ncbi:MAG: hypothetical protein ABI823_03585, partial [Bryobacteraceae bacterium]